MPTRVSRGSRRFVPPLLVVIFVVVVGVAGAVAAFVLAPAAIVDDSKFTTANPAPSPSPASQGSKAPTAALSRTDTAAIEERRLKARHDARTAIVQLVGALVLIVGGAFTWRTVWLTREGQITDRYSEAIRNLGARDSNGDDLVSTQVGAVYALERIARDSRRDHWAVVQLLVGFLRTHAGPAPEDVDKTRPIHVPDQVSAALTVLGRRKARRERKTQSLDLSGLDLRTVDLSDADLRRANLSETDLSGAFLERARLDNAVLQFAILNGAHLDDARLVRSDLTSAKLHNARLIRTDLRRAVLKDTTFEPKGVMKDVRGI